MSRRRMRTQAEWNVEAQMSLAAGPSIRSSRSFSSPAALLVKVMAMMDQGDRRVQPAQPLLLLLLLRRSGFWT